MSYSNELAEIMGIKLIKREQLQSKMWSYSFQYHELSIHILVHDNNYGIDEDRDEYARKEACKEVFKRLSELFFHGKEDW